jgi:hypothetical protein
MIIDSATRALIASRHFNIWGRLQIGKVGYAIVNLSAPKSLMMQAQWGEEQDSPCGAGQFQIFSDSSTILGSLSPFSDGVLNSGPDPLMYPGAFIGFDTSVVAPGEGPGAWQRMFTGRVDKVNVANDEKSMSLVCRDLGGFLLNRWFWPTGADKGESAVKMASSTPRLDVLIDDILFYANPKGEFHFGVTKTVRPIQAPEVPNFFVTEYPQEPGALLEILQQKALQIGWDCRYRYNTDSNLWLLHMLNPDKSLSFIDARILPSEYLSITKLEVDDTDVRNYIEVIASDRSIAYAENLDSQDKYDFRPTRIAEDTAQHIDNITEAQNMADAAVRDLAYPSATHECELLYWPLVQLNDIQQYAANGKHYTRDLTFTVQSYQHSLGLDKHRTTITARGNPITTRTRWLNGFPRMQHIYTTDPVGTAKERAVWYKVLDTSFLI